MIINKKEFADSLMQVIEKYVARQYSKQDLLK